VDNVHIAIQNIEKSNLVFLVFVVSAFSSEYDELDYNMYIFFNIKQWKNLWEIILK
jgi:hypothetical protein